MSRASPFSTFSGPVSKEGESSGGALFEVLSYQRSFVMNWTLVLGLVVIVLGLFGLYRALTDPEGTPAPGHPPQSNAQEGPPPPGESSRTGDVD